MKKRGKTQCLPLGAHSSCCEYKRRCKQPINEHPSAVLLRVAYMLQVHNWLLARCRSLKALCELELVDSTEAFGCVRVSAVSRFNNPLLKECCTAEYMHEF